MPLRVSILRSSSGSTFCSLLKLCVKKLIILLNVSVMLAAYRVYVYMLYVLQGGWSVDWHNQSTDLPATHTTYTHTHDMLPHHRNV